MESASLRIKFTPLLQESLKNDSKCCLEIVPEVTYIQNLEKIDWKEKTDYIEYIIPMTYKVILKKRQCVKEKSHDLEKVFYSCVDLPSFSLDLGRTDITRVFSDTLILGKLTTNSKKEIFPNKTNKLKSKTNFKETIKYRYSECSEAFEPVQSLNAMSNNMEYMDQSTKVKVDVSTSHFYITDVIGVDNNSINQIVSTESQFHMNKDTQIESNETFTEISRESNKDLRKLSLTPICSINTSEQLMSKHFQYLACDQVVCRMYESQKVMTGGMKIKDISFESSIEEMLAKDVKMPDGDFVERPISSERLRERPEITVAKFIKKMESEIMPLKMMLHDIIQKCSYLGLTKNGNCCVNSFKLKNVPENNNKLENGCNMENKAKCNRVVYSVVFDR